MPSCLHNERHTIKWESVHQNFVLRGGISLTVEVNVLGLEFWVTTLLTASLKVIYNDLRTLYKSNG